MPQDPRRMVVPSALPLKLICDVTGLWRNLALPSEIFCVRHCNWHRSIDFTSVTYVNVQRSVCNAENRESTVTCCDRVSQACFCRLTSAVQRWGQFRRHRGALVGLDPRNKAPSPSNWNMNHYTSVEFLFSFRMSSPPHKRKTTPQKRKAPLLKTFWRRFWMRVNQTSVSLFSVTSFLSFCEQLVTTIIRLVCLNVCP